MAAQLLAAWNSEGVSKLYTVSTSTAQATLVGTIGDGSHVIALGIPLVLTAEAILYSGLVRMDAEDLFSKAKRRLGSDFLSMCVTPKDIDAMVKDGASILSYGLNLALLGENYGALEGLMR